jgi:4-amino-4-deoxy-L-arabinose transferase-like glycosyltransferase
MAAALAVVLLGLLTRELGGGRLAQRIAAWAYASTASVLMFGHVLLPATLDLALWLAILWAATRAVLRDSRWWLSAGVLIGLTVGNRWLVAVLAVAIAGGVLLLGPRRALRQPWLWAGVAAAAMLTAPHLAWQAAHNWPQLAMGGALAEGNASDVRATMWILLLVLLGPPLVPVWLAGIRYLWVTPALRPARFLVLTLVVLLAFTLLGATQPHYFMSPLAAMLAAGCVPLGERLEGSAGLARVLVGALVLNALVSAVIALPLLPPGELGRTPVPSISPLAADQVGWPAYVETVAAAYEEALAEHGGQVAIMTTNYGEAGAIARYGPELGLPRPVSGHNHLHRLGGPAPEVDVVLMVGGQAARMVRYFDRCEAAGVLDNGVGVDNEEQGMPVLVCTGPVEPWQQLWPPFAHLN